jgi:murein L,D-transpeptidase YcbB/YkuD
MKVPRPIIALCALALLGVGTGCKGRSIEERAREAEKKMKDSLGPDLEAVAIAQPLDPAVTKEVQENLTAINEYQGELNGKLDSVTVNAIQAFQRTAGLKDDGIVDEQTRTKLQTAGAEAKQKGGAAKPAA